MRAYITHALADNDLFLLRVFSSQLRENGYFISSPENWYSEIVDDNTKLIITNADLFVGIISQNSLYINKVIEEWKIAKKNKIDRILFAEKGTDMSNIPESDYEFFDKNNLELSLQSIKDRKGTTKKKVIWIALATAAILALIAIYKKTKRAA